MRCPVTDFLLYTIIEQMGGTLARIVVNDLRDETYFAVLEIHRDGEVIKIDSRPSDAIALAVRTSVPILVDEQVLNKASVAG